MTTAPTKIQVNVDNETLTRNLTAIASRNPRAAKLIAEAEPRTDIHWHDADDGAASVKVNGRWLASRRRPLEEAKRLAEGVDLEVHGCAVILGFGVGHHAAALAARAGRELTVLVYEPDVPLLRAVLERVDHSGALASGIVVMLTDPRDGALMSAALKGAEAFVTLGTEYVHHPPSVDRLGASAKQFCDTFAKCVSAMRTLIATTLMQSDVTARNQLMNADRYATCGGINDLKDAAKGRLGVVVSAGPSLQRNLHELKRTGVRDRCAIVAVQTVLRPMLEAGIKPHFITALDYHEVSKRFYEGLTREDVEGITLIVEPKANAAILEAWPGEVRVVGDAFLDEMLGEKIVRERQTLKSGATVAHLCYYVARHLGCDPVALIGQDLAFTDGQYYAKGAAIHDAWACELNPFNTLEMMEWQRIVRWRGNLHRVEDHLGRPVFTDDQMATYLAQFERDFMEDTEAELTVIDATEGGVKKEHAQIRTLRETIDAFAAPDAPPIHLPSTSSHNDQRTLAKVRDRLRKLARDSDRIAKLSKEATDLLEKMETLGDENRREINELVERVHTIRDRVERLVTAWRAVQQLSQTAMFKRFKADRLLRLAEGIDEIDAHARRVERDIVNVRWIAEVGEYVSMLFETAADATAGGERLTRDLPLDETAGVVRRIEGTLPCVVTAPMRQSPIGVKCDLADPIDGVPALTRTLSRLASCKHVGRIAILTDDAPAVRDILGGSEQHATITIVEVDSFDLPRGIRTSRLFAPTCWRGGLGNVSVYDEIIEPASALRALEAVGSDSALFVGGGWTDLYPSICDQIVERHLESPASHKFVFSQASVGLAGVVHSRDGIEAMLETRRTSRPHGLVGSLVGYIPTKAMSDPVTRSWCVGVDLDKRLGDRRYTTDGASALPTHITIELTTDRGASHPTGRTCERSQRMDPHRARAIIDALDPVTQPLALTFDGFGDPLRHPDALELISHAKARGIQALHVRTDLIDQDEDDLRELLKSGVDVVSIDLSATEPETYAELRGIDTYERAQMNTEWLIHNRTFTEGIPDIWVCPRITRRDEVYEQIERFYDAWLLTGATPIIDPLHAPIEGTRIEPLGKPKAAETRMRRTEMLIRADGTVPLSARDEASEIVANLNETPFETAWRALLTSRDAITANGWTGPDDLLTE